MWTKNSWLICLWQATSLLVTNISFSNSSYKVFFLETISEPRKIMWQETNLSPVTLATSIHSEGMLIVSSHKVRKDYKQGLMPSQAGDAVHCQPKGRADYGATRKVYYHNAEPFLYPCTYEIIENTYWSLPSVPGTELPKLLNFLSDKNTRRISCSNIWSLTPSLTQGS